MSRALVSNLLRIATRLELMGARQKKFFTRRVSRGDSVHKERRSGELPPESLVLLKNAHMEAAPFPQNLHRRRADAE